MRDLNTNDYVECAMFHGKSLDVINGAVYLHDIRITFDDTKPRKNLNLEMFNHDGYWMLAGVDKKGLKFVIAFGEHK